MPVTTTGRFLKTFSLVWTSPEWIRDGVISSRTDDDDSEAVGDAECGIAFGAEVLADRTMPVVRDIHGVTYGNYIAFNSSKVLTMYVLLTDSIQEATTAITDVSISRPETQRDFMYTNKRAFRCSHVAGAPPIDPDTVGLCDMVGLWEATSSVDPASEGYTSVADLRDAVSGSLVKSSRVRQFLVWKTMSE